MPTLIELMEQDAPGHLEGGSLASAVSSDAGPPSGEVVIEWNGSDIGLGSDAPANLPDDLLKIATREEISAAVSDRLRTVISRDGRWKLNLSPMGHHELFKLEKDPLECENVFGRPGSAPVTSMLAERHGCRQRETGDSVKLPEII